MIEFLGSRARAIKADRDNLASLLETTTEERNRLKRELEQARTDIETWKRAANNATATLNRVRSAIADQHAFSYRVES